MQATGDTFATRKSIEPVQTAVQQGRQTATRFAQRPFEQRLVTAEQDRGPPQRLCLTAAGTLARQPCLDLTSRKQQLAHCP